VLLGRGVVAGGDLLAMVAIPPDRLSAQIVRVLFEQQWLDGEDLVGLLGLTPTRLDANVLRMLLERGLVSGEEVLRALR
jgi:hypothetical protein